MRLLSVTTLKLREFPNEYVSDVPEYAILSHTWDKQEVTFQAIQYPTADLETTAGFRKIKNCCALAESDGFQYVWIDTCCIDKTNSAELSEAINSMFQWYQDAIVCYAYLSDVTEEEDVRSTNFMFRRSRWFTRGWTLQELIAPDSLIFYTKTWTEIGTKFSLHDVISDIISVPPEILLTGHMDASIAQRMSWAANRMTTRPEDRAYCLMGLFGVNMPMIYGEGDKAFERLQLEIMKLSDDDSILAWSEAESRNGTPGPLAPSPSAFSSCQSIASGSINNKTEAFSMTNKGLKIALPLI
ncbi:heterokaryon incompatibility protein-domain-containing protein, partial [Xylogone sp. PMI_703]